MAGMTDYEPLPPDVMRALLTPALLWFNPEFHGLEALDLDKPALFVGNHTLYGLTDVPLLIEHLWGQYSVMLRALGDRGHLRIPVWGDLLARFGMVEGTPENCAVLMRAGENVLVFPGGIREVTRRKDEKYQLIWKKRAGFARLAIEHGYDIIPFGSVGADDAFDVHLDAGDVLDNPVLHALAKETGVLKLLRGGDALFPVVTGLGPTPIPKPQRYYFGFGPRIAVRERRAGADRDAAAWALREQVRSAVEEQLRLMQVRRAQDHESGWSLIRRRLAPFKK